MARARKRSSPQPTAARRPPMILGWREWVGLPNLGIQAIKAKLDTGARSSSLHVSSIKTFVRAGAEWVSFDVVADQVGRPKLVHATALIHDERVIRSSAGHEDLRIVVRTTLDVAGWRWPIDITLAERSTMAFRMLLGRQGLSGHAVVDTSHSYLAGRPEPGRRRDK